MRLAAGTIANSLSGPFNHVDAFSALGYPFWLLLVHKLPCLGFGWPGCGCPGVLLPAYKNAIPAVRNACSGTPGYLIQVRPCYDNVLLHCLIGMLRLMCSTVCVVY